MKHLRYKFWAIADDRLTHITYYTERMTIRLLGREATIVSAWMWRLQELTQARLCVAILENH